MYTYTQYYFIATPSKMMVRYLTVGILSFQHGNSPSFKYCFDIISSWLANNLLLLFAVGTYKPFTCIVRYTT
ncbi:hypothetical protein F4814DRAFT_433644 [Daldinia grandis]|nr:hypothetical protein F4814DRAFT_433644 [Daldinia grandis]